MKTVVYIVQCSLLLVMCGRGKAAPVSTTVLTDLLQVTDAFTYPEENRSTYSYPEENRNIKKVNLMQGDIVIQMKKNAVSAEGKLWTNRVVPYVINTKLYSSSQIHSIQVAMEKITNAADACIHFEERTFQRDFIYITKNGGCGSSVGRKGGIQKVSIDDECSEGNVMHELMHTLGFWHEHTRSDRDQFIMVNWNNIIEGHEENFVKSTNGTSLGLPYDYYSIMHYSSDEFSKVHGQLDTITPKDPTVNKADLGQRIYLSPLDIQKLKKLYSCDSLSCQKPLPISHGSWYGESFNVGDVLNYACDRSYQLAGAGQRTCKFNGKWSGAPPMCLPVIEHLQYCNFESADFCGWIQDTKDNLDWTRFAGQTPTSDTGPITDHTFATYGGYYAYMEASIPAQQGNIARLKTLRTQFNPNMCLLFFYCMNGTHMGNLTVKADGEVLTKIVGNKGVDWNRVYIKLDDKIGNIPDFQVIFEATRGIGATSDIAIDDVMIGSCSYVETYVKSIQTEADKVTLTSSTNTAPVLQSDGNADGQSCDFNIGQFCGWQQDSEDDIDWQVMKGNTATHFTVPNCDRMQCFEGRYIYIEASGKRIKSDTARLISPTFKGTGETCLTFYYHMYGEYMGSLHVNLNLHNETFLPLWNVSGNQGQNWRKAQVFFWAHSDFQVILEGCRGNGYKSDIAVDDVSLLPGTCPYALESNFENAFENLVNENATDNFDWTLRSGTTMTTGTGPSTDHTTGKGAYAYIDSSSPRRQGDVAKLISKILHGSAGGYCFIFWYNMNGVDVARLNINKLSENGAIQVIWSEQGNKGAEWLQGKVFIPDTNLNFQIELEAHVGTSYLSDIAVDDVSMTVGSCDY